MLTIFTATYNRAYILPELYQSLMAQTNPDFEWIIVDDASQDNTEELVGSFEPVGKGIRYYKQDHGGKHRAINLGLQKAAGDYFFIVDSDDVLTSDAVETILQWTSEIHSTDDHLAGVAGLRMSKDGSIWGGEPSIPKDSYIDAGNLERKQYGLDGDKAEVFKTEVLRKYPFPEFEGEYFLTEAVVWDSIALGGYKLRWYNKPIYICEYLADGLTNTGANDRRGYVKNPKGCAKYTEVEIKAHSPRQAIAYFLEYNNVAKECGIPVKERISDLNMDARRYYYMYCYSIVMTTGSRFKRKINEIISGENN